MTDQRMSFKARVLGLGFGLIVLANEVLAADVDSSQRPPPAKAHWSFKPVVRPPLPSLGKWKSDLTNPIDAFIAAKLESSGIAISPIADRVTLIRRLYWVMLGVPPAPEEVAEFLKDQRSDAFEGLVDQVLQDERYGERWARHWLDVVRFAESNGFETNRERPNAWRFRDYVIEAFNHDKPYDRFIREQIAGDAVGADVATGFLVAGPVDIVGSPDPVLTAQQRADELDDMVSTTGTAFLGLTLGCARCHSHKFDPVTQHEYYALAAVFAGVKHGERPLRTAEADDPAKKKRVDELRVQLGKIEVELTQFEPLALPNAGTLKPGTGIPPLRSPVQPRLNVDRFAPATAKRLRFTVEETAGGNQPCLDELEVYAGGRNIALASAGAKTTASSTLPGHAIHKLEHVNDGRYGNDRSWISNEPGCGWVEIELPEAAAIEKVLWGRDREGKFSDRLPTKYKIEVADASGAWRTAASSADRQKYEPGKNASLTLVHSSLTGEELARGTELLAERKAHDAELKKLTSVPAVYAGTFRQPSAVHLLRRGDPMQQREAVPPGTPALFNRISMADEEPEQQRRVKLADWIANADNPLTARVLVNRLWQHHFGAGLVDTSNDFGRNGSSPTHPELLDWLASELVARGWSIKSLQRLILLSATWRQSSAPRTEALQVDAASRLLWRFPPRRIEAEAIRDGILSVSGVLARTPGGPSFYLHDVDRENVYHYHPKEEFSPAEFRRMVYAFKVRMEQDGIFGAFDCPDGSLVMPRRSVSTTPLQALNLFNSRFILQQAEALAARLEKDAGHDTPAQIRRAWSLAFSRAPSDQEAADAQDFAKTHGLAALCRAVLNANEFVFIP